MPQDPAYEELEKDITEAHGGGRSWQEMAKNPVQEGTGTLNPNPKSLHPNQIAHKNAKNQKGC